MLLLWVLDVLVVKLAVLLVASMDWSLQSDESVWHQAVSGLVDVGSDVTERWFEVERVPCWFL